MRSSPAGTPHSPPQRRSARPVRSPTPRKPLKARSWGHKDPSGLEKLGWGLPQGHLQYFQVLPSFLLLVFQFLEQSCPQGICSPLSLGLSPPPSPLKFWGERLLVLQPMFPPWGGLPGTTCNCSHPPHPSPSALRSVIESVAGTFGSVPGGTPHMDAGKSTQQASA